MEQVACAADDAVVFHHDGVVPLGEFLGNVFAKLRAAGHVVLRHRHAAAYECRVGNQVDVGDLPCQGEGHQRRGMGVQHTVKVGPERIDLLMERQLHRGLVRPKDRAVRLYAVDICAGQVALVNAGGRDPDIAVFVADGKVAAGGRGHAVLVDAVHDRDQLISGMHQFKIHDLSPSLISLRLLHLNVTLYAMVALLICINVLNKCKTLPP